MCRINALGRLFYHLEMFFNEVPEALIHSSNLLYVLECFNLKNTTSRSTSILWSTFFWVIVLSNWSVFLSRVSLFGNTKILLQHFTMGCCSSRRDKDESEKTNSGEDPASCRCCCCCCSFRCCCDDSDKPTQDKNKANESSRPPHPIYIYPGLRYNGLYLPGFHLGGLGRFGWFDRWFWCSKYLYIEHIFYPIHEICLWIKFFNKSI